MRSTFAGLNTMVRGIFSNQLSLDTVGHNITNASTEGYSRQSVNQVATRAESRSSLYGDVLVGTGVDAMSIQRARNIYADKQYWSESSTRNYYATQQTNYDKIEAVFDDSDNTGVLKAMQEFYDSWVNLSVYASDSASRTSVISKATNIIDRIRTAAGQLQDQIKAQYDDMRINIQRVNTLTRRIAELNQNIMQSEVAGGNANDLRDQRDLLVDELSKFTNVNVYEEANGMYTVVSNGITLVNRNGSLTMEMSDPINNEEYGVTDFNIRLKESNIIYIPQGGILKGLLDTIKEDKDYIDHLANISATFLTTFNTLHKVGVGIDTASTTNINFFGDESTTYSWNATDKQVTRAGGMVSTPLKSMQIINELKVSDQITAVGGQNLIAARAAGNGTADGSIAVELSKLFNIDQANTHTSVNTGDRAIGVVSINQYYRTIMSKLGADAEDLANKISAQDDLLTQITEWRQSTAGVDWNEELSNMIKFQKGYQACSRCLTAMDEMLDRLINSTGVVGR